ncbi:MAG: hypothetical protein JSU85_07520 [Candidatus Zixiibacteriota bacterium]|nr:MAG: hypothetical protein JSU85_07520 [candidate division Zixibacteria bacterium]
MDADQKKLIEEALKSDYFDKTLDIQIQKKALEMLKRYKWICTILALFILLVNAYLGFEIKDFYKSKLELQRAAKDLTMESSYLQKFNQMLMDRAQMREEQADLKSKLSDEKSKFNEVRIESISDKADNSVTRAGILVDEMKMIKESFAVKFNSRETEIGVKIAELDEERRKWQKKTWDIVRNSSTIFAYVERGGKEGDWDYFPKTFNLPYSAKKIKLIFKEVETIDSTMANGEKNKYKKAMIIMQVTDSTGVQLFDGAQYLTEHNPKDIPKTDHQITLQYAYTPPNVQGFVWPFIRIIPDFAVLAISLKNPDTFLNATAELAAKGY